MAPRAHAPGRETPPRHAGYDALTSDGEVASIRPVAATDRQELLAMLGRASDRSLYQRFCGAGVGSTRTYVDELVDPVSTLDAVVATLHAEVVAVGSTHRVSAGEAEVALLVEDVHQARGLGTLLLEDLVARARARGLRTLVATILSVNSQMIEVLHHSGVTTQEWRDGDELLCRISLGRDASRADALGRRDLTARSRSLARLMRPASVVVVGAGHRRGGVGHRVVAHLGRAGFSGAIYALNRSGRAVGAVPACRDVADLPWGIDLAVLAVGPPDVPGIATALLARGVGAVMVLDTATQDHRCADGAGVEGTGEAGTGRSVPELCRESGVRLLGPGSLGLRNNDPALRLDASLVRTRPRPGRVAVVTHSGAVASELAGLLDRRGIGTSLLVSLGEAPDVGPEDLVAYAAQDGATHVTLVHLDVVQEPRQLSRAASATTATTPVVLVDDGRREVEGGNGDAEDGALEALCRRSGITRVPTLDEGVDLAALQSCQAAPRGPHTVVVGSVSGLPARAAETFARLGRQAPAFTQHTAMRLRALLPAAAANGAVVDTTGADPDVLQDVLETLAEDPGVDALVVLAPQPQVPTTTAQHVVDELSRAYPLVTMVLSTAGAARAGSRVPRIPDPARAVLALRRQAQWARWVERRLDPRPAAAQPATADVQRARGIVRAALTQAPAGRWLGPPEVARVLAAYDVLTGPTVDLRHRKAAVRAGVERRPGATGPRRPDVVIGAVRRPRWGALVSVWRRGAGVDGGGDRRWALAPTSVHEADCMLGSLRLSPPLTSHHRSGTELGRLVSRVSELVEDLASVAELELDVASVDCDPFVVDARIRVSADGDGAWEESVRRLGPF